MAGDPLGSTLRVIHIPAVSWPAIRQAIAYVPAAPAFQLKLALLPGGVPMPLVALAVAAEAVTGVREVEFATTAAE